MYGNNTFETSDFADQRFPFRNRDGGLFSPTVIMEENTALHETNDNS